MLSPFPAGFLAYLLLLVDSLSALQLDLRGITRHSHQHAHLLPRAGPITLNNEADISYYADIVLGGKNFEVLVDTGSSDLWVAGDVQQSNDTKLNSSVSYAVGKIEGLVKTARLELGDQIIENQAFIQVPPSSKNPDGTGILGLGPSSGSFILSTLPAPAGAPVLDRLFLQDPSTPPYFTILLGRDKGKFSMSSTFWHLLTPGNAPWIDPTTNFNGTITIGSVLPEYNQITTEPKIPVTLLSESDSRDQHFQVQLDENGIIGPDGKAIHLDSSVAGGEDNRATAVLDCGFSLPQIPRKVADSIYGRFKDAEYTTVKGIGGVWVLPCEIEVNVTFVFGGKTYPMHPLDMTLYPEIFNIRNMTNSNGVPVCIGSFQPFTYNRGVEPTYDIILGMAFMRNVYTLFDYGDFIHVANTSANSNRDPYVQMHSITSVSQAHRDFVKVRLGGVDTTGQQGLLDSPNKNKNNGDAAPTAYYIIAGVVAASIVVIVGIFIICNRKHHRRAREGRPRW